MKFYADVMLARLGRWLRLIGFDTVIAEETLPDKEIINLAKKQGRILLTRDKKLYQFSEKKVKSYYVKSKNIADQLIDVVNHFSLEISFPEKTRCPLCNGGLQIVERTEEVPVGVKSDVFWKCGECRKVYWKGSHWIRIIKMIEEITKR